MAKNNNKIKFLSQSVLLEEKGLPGLNALIVLIVSLMLCAFIAWSMVMEIDDTVRVSGLVVEDPLLKGQFSVIALISPNEIGSIKEGLKASVRLGELISKKPIHGMVSVLDKTPKSTADNRILYEAVITLNDSKDESQRHSVAFVSGMEVAVEITVGSRTFFNYFLGPIFNK